MLSSEPQAVRDFFVKYQDRILFGTDVFVILDGRRKSGSTSRNILVYGADDPDIIRGSPRDPEAVRRWKDWLAVLLSRYFEYFETDHPNLAEPGGFGSNWLRLTGVKLPPEILDKFYHANAERLVPGLAIRKAASRH